MADSDFSSVRATDAAPLIPRFAEVYLRYAERHRVAAEIVVQVYSGDPWPWRDRVRGPSVMVRFNGNRRELQRLRLLTAGHSYAKGRRYFSYGPGHGFTDLDSKGGGSIFLFLCKLPESIEQCPSGAELTLSKDIHYYHGTERELSEIATRFNARFPAPSHGKKRGGTYDDPDCIIQRIPDGSYVLIRETDEAFRIRRAETEAELKQVRAGIKTTDSEGDDTLYDFKTPDAYTKFVGFMMVMKTLSSFRKLKEVRTQDGFIYRLSPEAEERLKTFAEDLAYELSTAQVQVIKLDTRSPEQRADACDAAQSAATDKSFQSFLSQIVPRDGKDAE